MKPELLTGPIATRSIPSCNLHTCTKGQILESMENAYSLDEWLYTSIKEEEFFHTNPDCLRLPLVFYYAHTAVLYVNKLLLAGLIKERVDRQFEGTFEMGVNEMSWDSTDSHRMGGLIKWPTLSEVRAYRLKVRELVRKVIQDTPLHLPVTQDSKWWAIFMSIDHQRAHMETSSVLIRQLPVKMVEKPEGWTYGPVTSDKEIQENPMITAGEVDVVIGKDCNSHVWGWDNEYGCRKLSVPKFEASKFLVTNGDFLRFVRDGGYQEQRYWSEEGWKWKTSRGARHPTFWVCSKGCTSGCGSALSSYSHCNINDSADEYRLRLMFDVVALPHDWPVEVNYLEAKAFCAWKGPGYRLPTEAEHYVMRGSSRNDPTRKESGNINDNLLHGSPTPVGMFPPSSNGFCDVYGNVWEWAEDQFNGLPGTKSHYLYVDYSEPFYDGNHTMMMGGCWVTTGAQRGDHTRYAFRRHFFQHLGFRLARTVDMDKKSPVMLVDANVYVSGYGEQKSVIDPSVRKLGLEPIITVSASSTIRNDSQENLYKMIKEQYRPDFPINDWLNHELKGKKKALVIGCGPGRTTFELSAYVHQVLGCDVYGRCIDFATRLAREKTICYSMQDVEGVKVEDNTEIGLPANAHPERVLFKHLNWIPVEAGQFDVIVIEDIHRLPNIKAWIATVPDLVKSEDSLVITRSPDKEVMKIWNDIITSSAKFNLRFI